MDTTSSTDKVATWGIGLTGVSNNTYLEYKLKRVKRYKTDLAIQDQTFAVEPNSLKWNFKQIGTNSADKF